MATEIVVAPPAVELRPLTASGCVPAHSRPEFALPGPKDEETLSLPQPADPEPPTGATVFVEPTDARSVKLKLLAVNTTYFMVGVNDAATGALVPYLKPAYNIGLLFVALVYISNFAGFFVAAFTNVHLTAKVGTSGATLAGVLLQAFAYALLFWKPPYPLFVASFFFSGLGIAFLLAPCNTFVGNLKHSPTWLGFLHCVYGTGALVSPLVATTLATRTTKWHYFYLLCLGSTLANVVLIACAFRRDLGAAPARSGADATRELQKTLRNTTALLFAVFFFLYVGAEVTVGGWVVEFLVSVRHGRASRVGYVASGFWAGLALGRIALAPLTSRVGARRAVLLYAALAVACQIAFWLVPSIAANAVTIALLGFCIGPFYPAGVTLALSLLPRDIHVAALGLGATTGQAGSAAFPFLTGALAAKAGVGVLQPILIGLLVAMAGVWACIPKVQRRVV